MPGGSPAPGSGGQDTPIRLGPFHDALIEPAKRMVTLRTTPLDPGAPPEDVKAFREGEDACQRLAGFWSAMGYRINRIQQT